MSIRSSDSPGGRQAWRRLLDLLFPPRCVGCRRHGYWLCPSCLAQIPRVKPPLCVRCGASSATSALCARCESAPLTMERLRSVFYFEHQLRDAMHRLKYRGQTALAIPLGEEMAACWLRDPVAVDVVVPVPLHEARLRERGHNQASLLAREVARVIGLRLDEGTLVRVRATASQVRLSASARRENVRGAFRCRDGQLSDRSVLLVDDVCTTGATLDAAAGALYNGGARAVQGLTLARAR